MKDSRVKRPRFSWLIAWELWGLHGLKAASP